MTRISYSMNYGQIYKSFFIFIRRNQCEPFKIFVMEVNETQKDQTTAQNSQEQPDGYLMTYDRQEGKARGVKGINQNHELETDEPVTSNLEKFIRIDKQGNFFTNFGKNFLKEFNNPTRFILYNTPAGTPPEAAARQIETVQQSQDPSVKKSLNDRRIYNKQRFNPCEIPWEVGEKYGVTKESLQGSLEQMCTGDGSLKTIKVKMLPDEEGEGSDARLFLSRDESGQVMFDVHFVKQELKAGMNYAGYELSQENVDALNTTGNIGHPVDLILDRESVEKVPCYLSKDPLTNELYHLEQDRLSLRRTVKKHTFTDREMEDLKAGKEVGPCLFRSSNGRPFESCVQVNAQKRGLEFLLERGTKQSQDMSEDKKQKPNQMKFR